MSLRPAVGASVRGFGVPQGSAVACVSLWVSPCHLPSPPRRCVCGWPLQWVPRHVLQVGVGRRCSWCWGICSTMINYLLCAQHVEGWGNTHRVQEQHWTDLSKFKKMCKEIKFHSHNPWVTFGNIWLKLVLIGINRLPLRFPIPVNLLSKSSKYFTNFLKN